MRCWTLLVLPLVLATAAACGSDDANVEQSHSTTSLSIHVRDAPGAHPHAWTLRCDPAGGNLPDPAKACAALAKAKHPFAPVPKGQMCSMIYGGPQRATIIGTWRGTHVDATYSRTNGCQTGRWNAIAPVLATPTPSP